MTHHVQPSSMSNASEELLQLLKGGVDWQYSATPREYIDVLGEAPRRDLFRDQGMFRFRALPPLYERFWRPSISRVIFGGRLDAAGERRIALELLEVSPGERVVDVGCGTGNYTRLLADAARDGVVVGVDASRAMIAAAAKRSGGPNLCYVRGDACALPFGDGLFDAACSIGVIHMIDDPMMALDEMTRVLAPRGRLVVVATCERSNLPRVRGQMTAFGRDELTRALAERGFTDVQQRVVGRGQFVSGRRGGGDQ